MFHTRVFSDLHLEFYPSVSQFTRIYEHLFRHEKTGAHTILVLCGDLSSSAEQVGELLAYAKTYFDDVIFVAGNHEYYCSDFQLAAVNDSLARCARETGCHFLNSASVTIAHKGDGSLTRTFYGCTLWTDVDITAFIRMNDRRFVFRRPEDWRAQHEREVRGLVEFLESRAAGKLDRCVVVSHHLPTARLIHERFRDSPLTRGFASEVVERVDHSGVSHWFCGHTHESGRVTLGATDFWVNPIGYRGEHKVTRVSPEWLEL